MNEELQKMMATKRDTTDKNQQAGNGSISLNENNSTEDNLQKKMLLQLFFER